ncbi:CapA family protein [Isoptericola aurantiacus]|uniref:CapA family protein n=1 Tax=Isoptericola aurantiacus TaxID=3377839 RepID=UPI00383B73EE
MASDVPRPGPAHARAHPAPHRAAAVTAAALLLVLTACGLLAPHAPEPAPTLTTAADVARAKVAPPPPAPPASFTLVAAGDLLPHGPVVTSADGGSDFASLLDGLDDWVAGADLALCHMEVPVAPEGTAPSGYPLFGAPEGLVPALAEQGWDGCSTASNHSVDRGYPGVVTTLDAFDAAGMGHAGTARSAAEQSRPQLYRLARAGQEITVAHLSATYGLNGLPVPADAPWAVDLIDADALVAEAKQARRDGADVVLVSLHAGVEYTETLTDQQVDVVAELAASHVVDLVIGHHAHVPQRIDRLDGGPGGTGMWVAYGLGNLLSNQSAACCDARTSNGVLLSATFAQERASDPLRVTRVRWTGTTVDIPAGHRAFVIRDLLDDRDGSTLSAADLAAREQRVADAVGEQAAERTEPPEPSGPPPTVVPRGAGQGKG